MPENLTDAHRHFSDATAAQPLPPDGVAACALCACFANEWAELGKLSRASVKKVFGIHPDTEISRFDDAEAATEQVFSTYLPELEKYLGDADALGEIGLDSRISDRVPPEMQKRIFCAQLALAYKYNLPFVVHCVGEWGAVFDTVSSRGRVIEGFEKSDYDTASPKNRFLLHAASCSAEMTERFSKIGAYFSFGMRELSTKRGAECARAARLDRILVESDGDTADARILADTVAALAQVRGASAEEIADATFANFHTFYSK